MVTDKRPINLDLKSLRFPPMAIVSILHRISGVVLFLFLPFMLCYLGTSLQSSEAFDVVKADLSHPLGKILMFVFLAAWIYHVIAGIRHMLMDLGVGESLAAGRWSAVLVLSVAVLSILSLGAWLW